MSKIGRMSIKTANVKINIQGQEIHYTGKKASGVYIVPNDFVIQEKEQALCIVPHPDIKGRQRDINRVWGLHRALISNAIIGSDGGFEKQLKITGLGFKAAISGKNVVFSLGYSHKIDFELPENISIEVDKTGQILTVKSSDKELIGLVCSKIKNLKKTEPYKGTGIKLSTEEIVRKSGKAKSS